MQQEQNLGSAAEAVSAAPAQAPVSQVSQPTESSQGQSARVTYTPEQQAHVDSLVGVAKKAGYDKALRESQAQAAPQAPAHPAPNYSPAYQPAQKPYQAPPQVDTETLRQMIGTELNGTLQKYREQFEEKRKQEEATQLLNDLTPKVQAAKQKYADFDQKVDFGVIKSDQFYKELNKLDNAGDVIYKLMDSPMQLKAIEMMMSSGYDGDIRMAKNELAKLSNSMKNNESSAGKRIPNEPLRDVRPSKVNDSGEVNLTKAARDKYARHF